jgi:4-amino-4-deoxy-L-arabinose transferase-like glycosyltransferase
VSGEAMLLLVALAAGARLLAALTIGNQAYFPDETAYVDAAHALLAGQGFGAGYYRGPIYPALLAGLTMLVPGTLTALRVAQGLVAALGTILVVDLAERIFGRRTALVAGAFYALDPLLVVSNVLLYPETLTALIVLLVARAALNAVREARVLASIAAGLGLAVAMQLRPIAFSLLPVVALWIAAMVGTRRVLHATAIVIACLAGIAPWMAMNQRLYGRVLPEAVFSVRDAQGIGRAAEQGTADLVTTRAKGDPLAFLRRTAGEFAHFWEPYPQRLATDDAAYRARLHGDDARIATAPLVVPRLRDTVSAVSFGAELLLAAYGLVVGWRTRRAETLLLALLVLSYAIACTLFYAKIRYRIPVLPYILTFSAVGAINFLDILRAPTRAPRSGEAAPTW